MLVGASTNGAGKDGLTEAAKRADGWMFGRSAEPERGGNFRHGLTLFGNGGMTDGAFTR